MIKREQADVILHSATYFPVVGILGPRQSGKTTLARAIFNNHTYVTLEDPDIREAATNDPRTFLLANASHEGIIIDEFQHVPALLSYIQTQVDEKRVPGYFILTGSQNFLMNQAITQSLAGRISLHTLLPLSINELKNSGNLQEEIEPLLYQGCYPALYAQDIPPLTLYRNYIQTYLERDVRQLSHVGDLALFQTFLRLCAARIGQPLNLTALGNDCGISDNTVNRWITILEASYIVFRLYPYHSNFSKRLVKTPKLYFYDTGLVCNLLNIKEQDLMDSPQRGAIFESFIIADIMKQGLNRGEMPHLYYWKDKTGHEVDCIIDQGKKAIAIEIKASRTISSRFFEGLNYWNALTNADPNTNFIIYAGSAKQPKASTYIVSWQAIPRLY